MTWREGVERQGQGGAGRRGVAAVFDDDGVQIFKPAAGHAVVAVSGRGRFAGVGAYGHQGDGRRDPDAAAIGPAYPVGGISPLQFASFVAGAAGIAEAAVMVAVMVAVGCVLALLRRLLMPLQLQGELGRQGQLRQRGRWRWRLRWRGGRGWRGALPSGCGAGAGASGGAMGGRICTVAPFTDKNARNGRYCVVICIMGAGRHQGPGGAETARQAGLRCPRLRDWRHGQPKKRSEFKGLKTAFALFSLGRHAMKQGAKSGFAEAAFRSLRMPFSRPARRRRCGVWRRPQG